MCRLRLGLEVCLFETRLRDASINHHQKKKTTWSNHAHLGRKRVGERRKFKETKSTTLLSRCEMNDHWRDRGGRTGRTDWKHFTMRRVAISIGIWNWEESKIWSWTPWISRSFVYAGGFGRGSYSDREASHRINIPDQRWMGPCAISSPIANLPILACKIPRCRRL